MYKSYANCVYTFSWVSAAACPEDWEFSTTSTTPGPAGPPTLLGLNDCKVEDPISGSLIDLSDLAGSTVTTADGAFSLAVCSSVASCGSSSTASICSGTTSYGQYTAKPTYDQDGVSITYYAGDKCAAQPNQQYTATIMFTCDPTTSSSHPVLRDQEDCSVVFEWPTSAACEEPPEIECVVKDAISGKEYDFSSLIRNADEPNWSVTSPFGETFEINICDALTGQHSTDR